MKKQPNIIYLLNDHQAYYGHTIPKRPCFEAFAKEGVEFENTYTACPLCGPARRTMLTGLYPHHHQELINDQDHPYDRETYLDILAANGYRNYYFGKWHAGPGTAFDHHCEGFSYPSYNNPYTKPEYKEYLERYHLPEPEVRIERSFISRNNNLVEGELYRQTNKWCNEHATGVLMTPKETHEAFFLAELACEKLEELAASPSEQPFSLRVDFWGPHQPYFPTQESVDWYKAEDIPEYPSFCDDLSGKPEVYWREDNTPMGRNDRLLVPNPMPWTQWQKVLQKCYAQISLVDAAGGKIIRKLKELGMYEDCLIIWTTDHGDAVASHGGHFDKRSYLSEEMLRIPLAMRYSGVLPQGIQIKEAVSNTSLAPTMLAAAGLHFEQPVDGENLIEKVLSPEPPKEAYMVSESYGHMEKHFALAISDGEWKYVYNRGQLGELYCLSKDPYEMKNLIQDEAYKDQRQRIKKLLLQWAQKHENQDALKEFKDSSDPELA